jgi:transcriptional regulator with XRE-family HTH domain
LVAQRARLEGLRRDLGAQLATYRTAAVISQPQLSEAIGRTRSTISKIEHGVRGMPAELWMIADELCGAGGALVKEYQALAAAEQDYRDRCRTYHRQAQIQQASAQRQTQAMSACPTPGPSGVLNGDGGDGWPDKASAGLASGLVEELMQVISKLVQILGRRDAIRLLGGALTAAGLSGVLDPDEYTRLTHAVQTPHQIDAHVINNVAVMLAYCKRLEDTLGPCQVLDTVTAQHRLVHRLLDGGCPDHLVKSLTLVDSTIACTIGGYLIDMGHPEQAKPYFEHARKAAHDAGNTIYAAYAAAHTSMAAFLRADTVSALDNAAAARSLAARTSDPRLQALAEQTAAAAYTLDNQYRP